MKSITNTKTILSVFELKDQYDCTLHVKFKNLIIFTNTNYLTVSVSSIFKFKLNFFFSVAYLIDWLIGEKN